jgi:predicted secreted acid phosphatase
LRFRITQNARSTHPRKMAIVMDIDDTALSNYPAFRTAGFPEIASDRRQIAGQGPALAIPFTLAFYNFAKAHHVHVIFVSLRAQALRVMTENNLQKVGFSGWDALLLRPNDFSDQNSAEYYQSRRADLRASGYDIIMNIGHRDRSLLGGGSDIDFKLPDPYLQLFL